MKKQFNQIEYQNEWQKEKLDRITVTVKKGRKKLIKAHSVKKGHKSLAEYIRGLIEADMEE